jgi:hypothetical protein
VNSTLLSDIHYVHAFLLLCLSWGILLRCILHNSDSRTYRYFIDLKAKAVPIHAVEALWGKGSSSYSFLTLALDGSEWSASRPSRALPPGKGPPVPTVQEAGWAPQPVWLYRPAPQKLQVATAPASDTVYKFADAPGPRRKTEINNEVIVSSHALQNRQPAYCHTDFSLFLSLLP